MNFCRKVLIPLCMIMLLLVPAAMAKTVKHFAVSPFAINGPEKFKYLSGGIQDMLTSRIHWADNLESVGKDKIRAATKGNPVTDGTAVDVLNKLGVDYIIYGSVTILGNSSSVDVRVTNAKGETIPKTMQVDLDKVIGALENVAKSINNDIFGRTGEGSDVAASQGQGQSQGPERVNAMNPLLVHNESSQGKDFYLNPQFRYSGDSQFGGRLRSPTLPYVGGSVVVGDADGDGQNECFIGAEDTLYAYRFNTQNQMEPIGEYKLGNLLTILRMSLYDMNRDGYDEIIISAVYNPMSPADTDTNVSLMQVNTPQSYILNFRNGQFQVVQKDIKLFMATTNMPPNFMPVLVGQQKGSRERLFSRGVHEVVKMGGEYSLGGRLMLPPNANVYNSTFLKQEGSDYKIVLTNENDRLSVYSRAGDLTYTTDKVFSGSSLGLVTPYNAVGLRDRINMPDPYYIPLRLVPFDLDKDDRYELLANHPVSVSAQYFTRYRFFPQGEVHSLAWDGVGLNLVWKTRRIKGSVVDYGVADINNDGIIDLYVLINTHPGVIGAKFRRTTVLIYPLDTSTEKGVIDSSFTED